MSTEKLWKRNNPINKKGEKHGLTSKTALWNTCKDIRPGDLVSYFKNGVSSKQESIRLFIASSPVLNFIVSWAMFLMYYIYIYIPALLIRLYLNYCILVINIIVRRSTHARNIYKHLVALYFEFYNGIVKFSDTKLEDIFTNVQQTYQEVKSTKAAEDSPALSLSEIAELIFYEEEEEEKSHIQSCMQRYMHHFVPPKLFKATVRVRSQQSLCESHSTIDHSQISECLSESTDVNWLARTPQSFPPTPSSRARVICRNSETISSTMFAVRDKLRMEMLSVSEDETSREFATQAQKLGKFAVFDDRDLVEGLVLTCGNHCAFKRGRSLCCTCKAMIAIQPNTYTYFEYSVTSAAGVSPCISLGLGHQRCPSNALVGSFSGSLGLYSDGQLLLEGELIQGDCTQSVSAGHTIGVLVYIPSDLDMEEPTVVFNLNGTVINYDIPSGRLKSVFSHENLNNEECRGDELKLKSDYFPTISILSEGTKVWCRFCEADVLSRDRESIGAPLDCRIYCLDRSLLLMENEN